MSLIHKKTASSEEIRNQYPLDAELQALKEKRDAEIRDVFTGKSINSSLSSDHVLQIAKDAVCDYLLRLHEKFRKESRIKSLSSACLHKQTRTTGEGYKGMVHQLDPEKKPNLLAGLIAIRKMHMRAIPRLHLCR